MPGGSALKSQQHLACAAQLPLSLPAMFPSLESLFHQELPVDMHSFWAPILGSPPESSLLSFHAAQVGS